jgi:multiple sugar transport system permease protein
MDVTLTKKRKEAFSSILKRYLIVLIYLLPFLLPFVLFFLIPVAMGTVISFMDYNPYQLGESSFAGFSNFAKLFYENGLSSIFWPAFGRTILFDIICVPLLIVIPLILAYLINLKPVGYKIFRAIIYLPSIVSITIVGILFNTIFASDSTGLFNAVFNTSITFLQEHDSWLRWLVILIASVRWQIGTNFIILNAALRDVPKQLYEASAIDGCSKFQTFIAVTLPGIKGSMIVCIFTTIIAYLGLYGQPLVLKSYFDSSTIDSPMILIQTWLNDMSKARLTGLISATGVFFSLIVMLISYIESLLMRDRKGRNKHASKYNEYVKLLNAKEQAKA